MKSLATAAWRSKLSALALVVCSRPLPSVFAAGGNDSVSILGLPRTLRTLSAFPLDPQRWTHNAVGGTRGLGYDSTNKRLFVVETGNHRVVLHSVP